jgi:hypothetical protein
LKLCAGEEEGSQSDTWREETSIAARIFAHAHNVVEETTLIIGRSIVNHGEAGEIAGHMRANDLGHVSGI